MVDREEDDARPYGSCKAPVPCPFIHGNQAHAIVTVESLNSSRSDPQTATRAGSDRASDPDPLTRLPRSLSFDFALLSTRPILPRRPPLLLARVLRHAPLLKILLTRMSTLLNGPGDPNIVLQGPVRSRSSR